MALTKRRVAIPFTVGQRGDVAAELLEPPALLRAVNGIYDKQGKITKRNGWQTQPRDVRRLVTDLGTLPVCERLAKRDDEILWIADNEVFGQTPGEAIEADGDPQWNLRIPGAATRFTLSSQSVVSQDANIWPYDFDTAYAGDADTPEVGGVQAIIWRNNGTTNLYCRIRDVLSGGRIWEGQLADDDDGLHRVLATKGSDGEWTIRVMWLAYDCGTGGQVFHRTCQATTPYDWTDKEDMLSATEIQSFDAVVHDPADTSGGNSAHSMIVWASRNITGSDNLQVYRMALGAAGAYTTHSPGLDMLIPATPLAGRTLMAAVNPAGTYTAAIVLNSDNETYSIIRPVNDVMSGTVSQELIWSDRTAPGICWFPAQADAFLVQGQITATLATCFKVVVPAGDYFAEVDVYNCPIIARPFYYRDHAYLVLKRAASTDQVVVDVVRVTQQKLDEDSGGDPVPWIVESNAWFGNARILDVSAGTWHNTEARCSVVEDWSYRGRFYLTLPLSTTGQSLRGVGELYMLDGADPQLHHSIEYGGGTILCGAVPTVYDGKQIRELGFPHRPQSHYGDVQFLEGSAGGGFSPATYSLRAVFEFVDAAGRIVESAPSTPVSLDVASAVTSFIVYVYPIRYSRMAGVQLALYLSNDGVNFQRVNGTTAILTGADTTTTVTIYPTAAFQTGFPYCYTDGGVLENTPPPACKFGCLWGGRVWLGGLESPCDIAPSKALNDDVSPGFNEALRLRAPRAVTGLAAMGERLLVLARDGCWWTAGLGPTDTGQGDPFLEFQIISPEIGCISARSIVETEVGVFFQSLRGIELVGNGLQVEYIGAPVEDIMRDAGYSEVVAAVLDGDATSVRFAVRKPYPATDRMMLVFHLAFRAWTVHTSPPAENVYNTPYYTDIVSMLQCRDRLWLATGEDASEDTGRLMLEAEIDDGVYADGSAATPTDYSMLVETPWIKLDGLMGFVRAWRATAQLSDVEGDIGFTLSYRVGYRSAYIDRAWAADGALDDVFTNGSGAIGVHLAKQQGEAIQIKIADQVATGIVNPDKNTRWSFVALGLEYGVKRGTGRLPEKAKR